MFVLEADFSNTSMGSTSYQFGYQEVYDSYLMQFKNKSIQNRLKDTYEMLKKMNKDIPTTNSSARSISNNKSIRKLSKESEMEDFNFNNGKMTAMDEEEEN